MIRHPMVTYLATRMQVKMYNGYVGVVFYLPVHYHTQNDERARIGHVHCWKCHVVVRTARYSIAYSI